ncbi:hypothetical protein [Kitasatospora cathayae]|uniref:Uncharacterized protein n=1 Tax=Kitasatospora cathayae TaxID=3004092 RepID=A0ABY7QGZ0_9ACTN|nr:hypothetical protein [Kitasatospora sp. HUAS 3-15]WBP92038.1 hypothetical protein O1G21_40340 [Kitasatospora sp. HUAS 3-15]
MTPRQPKANDGGNNRDGRARFGLGAVPVSLDRQLSRPGRRAPTVRVCDLR